MSYQAIFKGWSNLALADLIVAYRKAKADVFFENTFPSAIKFADYEQDLIGNLENLLIQLKNNNGFLKDQNLLGKYKVIPKKMRFSPKVNIHNGHVHFSNPDRAFTGLLNNNEMKAEFRVIGDFPVDAHIISALWINMVGHKFDGCLNECCYGARLKRIRNDESLDATTEKPFHISAVGSFVPYFQPYQKWRADGLRAIRNELENEKEVIAVSLDLMSYYHLIDPSFISSNVLQTEIGLVGSSKLLPEEIEFTEQISKFLKSWSNGARRYIKKFSKEIKPDIPGGLAIGLTASRVISNVLLHHWDKLLNEKVTPIHYGRYVDDMFLVLRDPGNIHNAEELMLFLQERLGDEHFFKAEMDSPDPKNNSIWQISLGKQYQKSTVIRLQTDKQKLFLLQGQAGHDLLDSIEKEISELSSEHRLMPSPDQLDNTTAAKVLSAAGDVAEQADTLRRADGLTIRRLSWALQLRHVETLARDLLPDAWGKQRKEFYEFSQNHILRPDTLFSHFIYLPRLLGFAISLNEWAEAERIARRAFSVLDQLEEQFHEDGNIFINGEQLEANDEVWKATKEAMVWSFIDAATKYFDPSRLFSGKVSDRESRLANLFLENIFSGFSDLEEMLDYEFGSENFYEKAPLVAMADLAKVPYKNIIASKSAKSLIEESVSKDDWVVLNKFEEVDLIDIEVFKLFESSTRARRLRHLNEADRKKETCLPYLFPTRPLRPDEIAELAPECVGIFPRKHNHKEPPPVIWARYVRALRGVWVKPTLLAINEFEDETKNKRTRRFIVIGEEKKKKIVVALTNFKTTDAEWADMACKKSICHADRYKRISALVKQVLALDPKPDYLLFPELSIPLNWINSLAATLSSAGISLIAGAEYRHEGKDEILSETCLVLADNRLGFPSWVRIWQPKLQPAVKEEEELLSLYGKTWFYPGVHGRNKKPRKPVYNHNGFYFGVMACSELQNSKERIKFQGDVDALMVLAWNKDLDTFSSLIESAALDVHAYTILVNNRLYGDSRVRSPAKKSFMRDLARVRGGDNDFVVAVTLDIEQLRAFQSRKKRWPRNGDIFKTVPEGFKIRKSRRVNPPK